MRRCCHRIIFVEKTLRIIQSFHLSGSSSLSSPTAFFGVPGSTLSSCSHPQLTNHMVPVQQLLQDGRFPDGGLAAHNHLAALPHAASPAAAAGSGVGRAAGHTARARTTARGGSGGPAHRCRPCGAMRSSPRGRGAGGASAARRRRNGRGEARQAHSAPLRAGGPERAGKPRLRRQRVRGEKRRDPSPVLLPGARCLQRLPGAGRCLPIVGGAVQSRPAPESLPPAPRAAAVISGSSAPSGAAPVPPLSPARR